MVSNSGKRVGEDGADIYLHSLCAPLDSVTCVAMREKRGEKGVPRGSQSVVVDTLIFCFVFAKP